MARPEVLRRAWGNRSDLKPPQVRGKSCVPLRVVDRRNSPSPPTPLALALLSLQGTSPRRRGGEGSRYGLAAGKWRPGPERLPVWRSAIRMEVRLLLCWGWCNRTLRRCLRAYKSSRTSTPKLAVDLHTRLRASVQSGLTPIANYVPFSVNKPDGSNRSQIRSLIRPTVVAVSTQVDFLNRR